MMDEDKEDPWDIHEEFEDFEFYYDKKDDYDPDWIEVAPDHFVATTLKDRDAYYQTREEQLHEFARS
jgi:hypothetical protein